MSDVQTDATPPSRRIRPWVAALLTFLGWGVGLYYARRTKAAVLLAGASLLIGFVLSAGVLAYMLITHSLPLGLQDMNELTLVQLVITTIVAAVVWFIAAQHQSVEYASSLRLWGYLAIWLAPTLIGLLIAFTIRFSWIQPFRAPSGSMAPAIHVGDYFLVSKGSYGYSRFSLAPFETLLPDGRVMAKQPKRGDVIVFRPSAQPDRDFVKRLVGMPGDRIQMMDGALYINGKAAQRLPLGALTIESEYLGARRVQAYRETLPNGVSYTTLDRGDFELDNTTLYSVPAGHYFFMGDDRDNSADSRVLSSVGYVPFDNLIGRVDEVFRKPTTVR